MGISAGSNMVNWLVSETYIEQVYAAFREAQRVAPYTLTQQFGLQYSDTLWPSSRVLGNDPAASTHISAFPRVEYWRDTRPLGAGKRGRITGITRDSASAVLGSCAVHLIRTTGDVLVDTGTSDAGDGTYSVGTPDDLTYYVVAYKPGSPDVAGTTVNTLTGTLP